MRRIALLVFAALICAAGCSTPTEPNGSTPVLSAVAPSSVAFGDTVTVTGARFSATGNALKISSGYISQTGTSDGATLRFTISQSIGVCPPTSEACITLALVLQPGTYNVNIVNANGSSNAGALTITK